MGEPPEPYNDWHSWALAEFDNDPRRAGLAVRAATEAQSIGAGIDAAIRAAHSAAGAPPPGWVPNEQSIEVGPSPAVAQPASPPDFEPNATTIGAATTPGFQAVTGSRPASALDEDRAETPPGGEDSAAGQDIGAALLQPETKPAPNQARDVNSLTTGRGAISPDGNYLWNGTDWVRNIPAPAPTATTGPGTVSPDGHYIWNGTQWVLNSPVPASKPVKKINRGRRRVVFFSVFLSPFVLVGLLLWNEAQSSGALHVTYLVTGSARIADLTYTDGAGQISQQSGVDVPVVKANGGGQGIDITAGHHGQFVSISAQNTQETGDITCEIRAGGRTIATNTAYGGFTIASCSATVP